MISCMIGILFEKLENSILINVNGICYDINISMSTYSCLPEINSEIKIHTILSIREDSHTLYGFYSREEKSIFILLTKTNGVGPRLAIGILSSMNPNEICQCILDEEEDKLLKLPGVGKKMAKRLIVEMKDKIKSLINSTNFNSNKQVNNQSFMNKYNDTVTALLTLGYKNNDAKKVLDKINFKNKSNQDLIKEALQVLSI